MRHMTGILTAVALAAVVSSCSDIGIGFETLPGAGADKEYIPRTGNNTYRNVFLVYSMGFNNLTGYLKEDIEDIISSPLMSNDRDVLLIFSHLAKRYPNSSSPKYDEAVSPTLTRICRGTDGNVIRDTLTVYPDTYSTSDANTLNEVLTYVRDNFEADRYGMLMSSHGTGWMPEDYCNHPSRYDNTAGDGGIWMVRRQTDVTPKPFLDDPGAVAGPAVKSIGVQNISAGEVTEMDITDIAAAIPMKMDYIIFDACFMGGVEVAYEFRKVCDKMVFSQTEILAEGMDYETMTSYLYRGTPDLTGFCENYFNFYNSRNYNRAATISLIDCTSLEPLAMICREIFETRRGSIDTLDKSSLQKYYREAYASNHKWFFDLRDIAVSCGAERRQMIMLDAALEGCVRYKAATESFLERKIDTHCGLSMYCPYDDRPYLNNFYKVLEWNKATGLVE